MAAGGTAGGVWKNKGVTTGDKTKRNPGKRDAILAAMLDVVVEGGFHEAPMSAIAKRAGASAGVIYHHFASKQEIIDVLYAQVREIKTAGILKGYRPEMESRDAFLLVWTNMYHFYRKHKREMRFVEQYLNAGFACVPEESLWTAEERDLMRRFRRRSEGGELRDWPPAVLEQMSVGLAERLAKLPVKLSAGDLRAVGEAVWESIRARD